MILLDTSARIDFFRGREPLASAVNEALESGEAALCGPVLTELRRGLLNERERKRVLPLLDACRVLSPPDQLWADAGDLGFALRRQVASNCPFGFGCDARCGTCIRNR